VTYPYALGEVGNINNSTFGTSYYYYFYNWQVTLPSVTCESDRVSASVQIIGINEMENPLQIQAYPNPAADFVQLSAPKQITQATVNVFDMTGHLVMTQKVAQFKNQRIDVTNWAAGAYQIVISDGHSSSRLDLIVE
jgi:hypothetical protein